MIHGWASSGRMWGRLMDDLAGRFRCFALDLPGFGDSDKPESDWYTIQRYVELVCDFADALEIRQPAIIGHSMGGMIGLALAADKTIGLSHLVAMNPIVTGRTHLNLRLLANTRLGWPMLKLGRWFWPVMASDFVGPWLRSDRAMQLRRTSDEWRDSTPVSLVSTIRAMSECDLTADLPEVTAPTMILLGNRDLAAPNAEGKLAARRIPGARLVVLPTGHLPTDDLPEETAAVVASFLTGSEVAANLQRG